ncbi:uridine kinase [Microvirga sp.]|uniref:uridine kinase n=1 Tax=Microvirga sp. TaxID=1873136 RepID=UPI001FEFCA52|nr:uridine kinase [Microvirga sp.]
MEQVAYKIASLGERGIVAVDGVDGSGKTRFADELVPVIKRHGRPVIRASIDGFHNPRAIRYRRGKGDPEGFFRDSYNYDALRRHLIDPFRQGAAWVDVARFDHKADRDAVSTRKAEPSSVLLLDGIFLHRDELCDLWDYSIFLAVPFAVSYARIAQRDGSNPDPSAPEDRRYYEGQTLYLQTCQPQKRATAIIDNSRLEAPRLVSAH